MVLTKEGDVIVHKEIWESMKADEYFREFIEELEDIEDHYEAKADTSTLSFDDYLKNRK